MGEVKKYLQEAIFAAEQGVLPMRIAEGTNEIYVLYNIDYEPVGVFKLVSQQSTLLEKISYEMDHQSFAGVPETIEAVFPCPIFGDKRKGVFQCYVKGGLTLALFPRADDLKIAADQVRKIAILDIRLLNRDRHHSNLIYTDDKLIPIDHGDILSESCTTNFGWQTWPQVFSPFSEFEKSYIRSLNPLNDYSRLLEYFNFSKKRASLLYLSTLFLKSGMECGLTAGEIGGLMEVRCYPWLLAPTNLFKVLWDELQNIPMHLWDARVQEIMEQLYTCI